MHEASSCRAMRAHKIDSTLSTSTLKVFFNSERLPATIARLVNHNRIFLRDPVFEIVCICLSSGTCVTLMDKGAAFFTKDLSICMPYKSMLPDELKAIIALLKEACRLEAFYLNQQRGGGLCLHLRMQNDSCIPHIDVFSALIKMVSASKLDAQYDKRHLINILLQRFDKALKVDKEALRAIQKQARVLGVHENNTKSDSGI